MRHCPMITTDTPHSLYCTSCESWVDLSNQPGSPDRVTPLPFGNGEEYLRLLREAQRESNQSSARVSLASSRRDTPRDSPHDSIWLSKRSGSGGVISLPIN
ncbi:hypothetical protein Pcinc_009861 [Petrolisthes cinctipes]|uniref:Uncharacterized protein n=1 Tax=Petrolisthes cinctipes TaxID=88211 RepID=A0AAE1KW15_PETCI|nr:hypothetical protein Pcinc_009861 [Petrolisthes cinctipes]